MPASANSSILVRVLMDDPYRTPAQVAEDRARRPNDPTVGKARVDRDLFAAIGGLVFIRSRRRHHEQAAEWVRTTYERVYGGQGGGIAAGDVKVDKSTLAHDSGMAARIDIGRELHTVFTALGPTARDMVIAVVVLGRPVTEMAPVGPSGKPGGRARAKHVASLLDHLDRVAEMRGWLTPKHGAVK